MFVAKEHALGQIEDVKDFKDVTFVNNNQTVKSRDWMYRCVVLLLGSLVACFIGEVGVRLFPTWHDAFVQDIVYSRLPTDLYQPVGGLNPGEQPRKIRFVHHPNRQVRFTGLEYDNWVYTDDLGFRRSPTSIAKATADSSVLLLGDSFLFAGQVSWSDSVVGRLTETLPTVQWWNAGVDGYNTADSLTLWEEHEGAKPDEVWLFFFWGNDIWENDWASRPTSIPNEELELSRETDQYRFGWMQYSRFLSRLYAFWAISTDERFAEKNSQMVQLRDADQLEAALDSTQVQLERFTIQCVEASTACRVWLIPPMEAFQEPGLSEQVVPALLNHMPDSIDVTDLYPILKEQGGASLYFQSDPHWNSMGHAVVADFIQQTYEQE